MASGATSVHLERLSHRKTLGGEKDKGPKAWAEPLEPATQRGLPSWGLPATSTVRRLRSLLLSCGPQAAEGSGPERWAMRVDGYGELCVPEVCSNSMVFFKKS